MFAQSARNGGWRPIVIDQFADQDTIELSQRALKIDFDRLDADPEEFRLIVNEIGAFDSVPGVIYGGGVDHRFRFLEFLFDRFVVYGNEIEVLDFCYDPHRFFPRLKYLGIPFPETRYYPPTHRTAWLVKERFSEGGRGVRYLHDIDTYNSGDYFQKYISGPVLSVLFLADGKQAVIVGFNSQWSSRQDPNHPFLFSGLINRVDLDSEQKETVKSYVDRLVDGIGLKGLNSLDFILDGDICKITELNPRLSASMALYDEAYPDGLIAEHVFACQGKIGLRPIADEQIRAIKVVYASLDLKVSYSGEWPEWCVDRPFPGARILAWEAICSVTASGSCQEEVERKIKERENQILVFCSPFENQIT